MIFDFEPAMGRRNQRNSELKTQFGHTMKGIPVLNKKRVATIATLGIALIGGSLAIQPAQAFDPVANKYAIVGSDTLEDVVGALTNGTKITGSSVRTVNTDSSTNGSFDATGTSGIITKSGGLMFQRPNGSGDGRAALLASLGWLADGVTANAGFNFTSTSDVFAVGTNPIGNALGGRNVQNQVDLVRSSSAGTTGSAGYLQAYPFGRDAVSYAYGTSVNGANIPAADLVKIYQCDSATMSTYGVTNVYTPQTGSGTGKDFAGFLKSQGNSNATVTYGICVTTSQEHDASTLPAGGITPMSASRWVAMYNGASLNKMGTAALGSPVTGTNAVDIVSGVAVPNLAFYQSGWGRDTYIMVEKARVGSEARLAALLNYSDTTSLVYQGSTLLGALSALPTPLASTSQAVKQKFGFLPASTQTPFTVVK